MFSLRTLLGVMAVVALATACSGPEPTPTPTRTRQPVVSEAEAIAVVKERVKLMPDVPYAARFVRIKLKGGRSVSSSASWEGFPSSWLVRLDSTEWRFYETTGTVEYVGNVPQQPEQPQVPVAAPASTPSPTRTPTPVGPPTATLAATPVAYVKYVHPFYQWSISYPSSWQIAEWVDGDAQGVRFESPFSGGFPLVAVKRYAGYGLTYSTQAWFESGLDQMRGTMTDYIVSTKPVTVSGRPAYEIVGEGRGSRQVFLTLVVGADAYQVISLDFDDTSGRSRELLEFLVYTFRPRY